MLSLAVWLATPINEQCATTTIEGSAQKQYHSLTYERAIMMLVLLKIEWVGGRKEKGEASLHW
jgi:hypothetical protein